MAKKNKWELIPELAEALAKNMRDFGYPDVTAEVVQHEVGSEPAARSIVGWMVVDVLEKNSIPPNR